jgi:hypothetical protein
LAAASLALAVVYCGDFAEVYYLFAFAFWTVHIYQQTNKQTNNISFIKTKVLGVTCEKHLNKQALTIPLPIRCPESEKHLWRLNPE